MHTLVEVLHAITHPVEAEAGQCTGHRRQPRKQGIQFDPLLATGQEGELAFWVANQTGTMGHRQEVRRAAPKASCTMASPPAPERPGVVPWLSNQGIRRQTVELLLIILLQAQWWHSERQTAHGRCQRHPLATHGTQRAVIVSGLNTGGTGPQSGTRCTWTVEIELLRTSTEKHGDSVRRCK